jgi:hypothetical protein
LFSSDGSSTTFLISSSIMIINSSQEVKLKSKSKNTNNQRKNLI